MTRLLLLFSCAVTLLATIDVPITIEETKGFIRRDETVTTGVPLPRGAVKDVSALSVSNANGEPVPAQFEQLAAWPDGSAKWVLVNFVASAAANTTVRYRLTDSGKRPSRTPPLTVSEQENLVAIETGVLRAVFSRKTFDLFREVYLDHNRDGKFSEDERITQPEPGPGVRITDSIDRSIASRWGKIESFKVESAGPVRAILAVKGALSDPDGVRFLNYTARLHFRAGSGLVRLFFTLENPDPTVPLPGAHWVLGSPGGRFFEDASLLSHLRFDGPIQLSVGDGPDDILDRVVLTGKAGIYQDSSGGENWFHRNHINREGKIPLRFQGARAFVDEVEPYSRKRPDAWLHASDRRYGLAVAVRHFWQNFPKALSAEANGSVRVALWPEEFAAVHELQGGENKTHEVAFFFHTGRQGSTRTENRVATVMGSFHHPLYVRAPAEWYISSGSFDDAVVYDPDRFPGYERFQQGALLSKGNNLRNDLETIDEYGWRNFGDTWAKNETDKSGSPHEGRQVVNHYNLEYDLGYGMLFQSLRTLGTELSREWWNYAEAALRHESDIDVYHSMKETGSRVVYSGGKFTHTQHGVEAVDSTHRGSPRLTWFGSLRWPWGAGSSPESGHFNTRGQLCYYYFTGDRRVLESALEQTELVYRKVTENRFAQIDNLSREAGNNLQILTDAYLLTWDDKYRVAAEKILAATAPEKQWYTSEAGRRQNPAKEVSGFWTSALCIDSAARWTAVMEEKTGKPYEPGRRYVTAYADFMSRFLAGGPDTGFYMTWSPAKGGRGNHGPWTYRMADVVMFGHKYASDPQLKKRCLKTAADAFAFVEREGPSASAAYVNEKSTTMIISGGHQYIYFRKHGRWPE